VNQRELLCGKKYRAIGQEGSFADLKECISCCHKCSEICSERVNITIKFNRLNDEFMREQHIKMQEIKKSLEESNK